MNKGIHEAYIGRVADVLKRTAHPRQREVLEDLQAHLEESAARDGEAAHIDELIEMLGSPEEYAENLAPATGYRLKPWYRRRHIQALAFAVALGFFACTFILCERPTLAAHIRQAMGRNYSAWPFFDLKRAQALQPGATEQEIRDTIGIPWYRSSIVGREDEVIWEYTALLTDSTPFYTDCRVITDATDWRLLRVEVQDMEVSPQSRGIARRPPSRRVRRLRLTRFGQQELVLRPHDTRPTIIIRTRGSDADIDNLLEQDREWVTHSWQDVQAEAFRFVYFFSLLDMTDEQQEALKSTNGDLPVYTEFHPGGARWQSDGGALIYKDGFIYEYPPIFGGVARLKQSYRDDQNWLIHRLLSEDD